MASGDLQRLKLRLAGKDPARKPPTPDIARKADDLEAIKATVDSAANVSGALWLSYLFVMFYIAVAAGAVTHEDLLLQRPVRLPFLNVELPLLAFFFLAPILFVATHVYTIVHFNMLGLKAARFHEELHKQFKDEKEIRDKLRRLLPSNVLVQIFAGPPEMRDGRFGFVLKAIAVLTLVVGPVMLLLLLQIQFLPYHELWIIWAQRAALIFDIFILWQLRPPKLGDGPGGWNFDDGQDTPPNRVLAVRVADYAVALFFSGLAIWLSVVVATIPGEWQETKLAALDPALWPNPDAVAKERWVSTRRRLFAGKVDGITRRRESLFSNTLVLPGFDIYEALKIDDPKKLDWKDHLIDLRGRALDQAVFDGAKLPKADLTGAHLEGASLDGAQLQGASLLNAQLQGASLLNTQLQSASLDVARLQGASVDFAQLQGASLRAAQLQGASLFAARLQGASLDDAQLQGASLGYAQLQGASLDRAQLQGASLFRAQLQGASLHGAQLQGASLVWSYLWRADWGNLTSEDARPVELGWEKWEPLWTRPLLNALDANWTDETYAALKQELESMLKGERLKAALDRIARLDCKNPGKALASCDPAAKTPPQADAWRKTLDDARGDVSESLAVTLRELTCKGGENAIHILRDVSRNYHLAAAGPAAPALIDDILSGKDCPASAALTDGDRARLREIREEVEKEKKAKKNPPAAAPPTVAPPRTAAPSNPPLQGEDGSAAFAKKRK